MKNINFLNRKLIFSIFLLQLAFNSAYAQWSTDPSENNVICNAALDQRYPLIISDGSGGAIITWTIDRRYTDTDENIYAQRINSTGFVQWIANGATICDASRNQNSTAIVSDGSGGAIITWADFRDINQLYQIYAQKINSAGLVQWTGNGVKICNKTDGQFEPAIASDDSGGAIITWKDFRDGGAQANMYIQKIDSAGNFKWAENGIAICTAPGIKSNITIMSDGFGGAIITWQDGRLGADFSNIYTLKMDSAGILPWTPAVVILSDSKHAIFPTMTSDGSGGALYTWMDLRNGVGHHIYAQKVDSIGDVKWQLNGVAICTAAYTRNYPTIVSDGSGGAIITWEDFREGNSFTDIYAQKIDSIGAVQWTANGVAICTATADQNNPTIVSDGSGGAIITWRDQRNYPGDIYAQRIDSTGTVQWPENGIAISTAANNQYLPQIVSNGSGGAVITWGDRRNGSSDDIYAQKVNVNGSLGDVTGIREEQSTRANFGLRNYPNPVKEKTIIGFEISKAQMVSLKVYDLFGKEISTLINEKKTIGKHEIEFDASKINPGIYLYKLHAGSFVITKKMILIK